MEAPKTPERRHAERVRCFLPARTGRGEVVIDELGPRGGKLTATFDAEVDEILPLHIAERNGREAAFHGVVRRIWKTLAGYRMAFECEPDPRARARALRLYASVSNRLGS